MAINIIDKDIVPFSVLTQKLIPARTFSIIIIIFLKKSFYELFGYRFLLPNKEGKVYFQQFLLPKI